MAGTKISDYGVGTNKWSEMLTTIEKQRKGFISLSLTNYDNNSLPEISAGSYVEIAGALTVEPDRLSPTGGSAGIKTEISTRR